MTRLSPERPGSIRTEWPSRVPVDSGVSAKSFHPMQLGAQPGWEVAVGHQPQSCAGLVST